MPAAIPNGGGGGDPTTGESGAYNNAISKDPGDQTAADQQLIQSFEQRVQAIGDARADTGGPGGHQAAVALEVGRFAGALEARRKAAVDQYAPEASGGTLKARRAQSEMHGADTQSLVELAWLLFELRERLNDSPY